MMNDDTMNKGVEIPIEDGSEEMENMAEEVMDYTSDQSLGEEKAAGHSEENVEPGDGGGAGGGVKAGAGDAAEDGGEESADAGAEESAEAGAEESAEAGSEQDADAEAGSAEAGEGASETSSGSASAADDMQAKYMRLMADFQNYKRRTEKEKQDIYSYANEKMILPVLEVLDNFERALNQGTTDEKFQDGMEMILNQLNTALGKAGLKEIQALGEDFDPNFHSAVLMEDTEEYESGKVSNVIQKGYTLNGKVIRPSMVKVAN